MNNINETLVSIVMPCFKMGKFIADALDSISKQSYSNWEIIIVDDCGPDDGTAEIISVFQSKNKKNLIKYIRLDVNSGVSAARNKAIENAQGHLISFLDPDDIWKRNHLHNCVKELKDNTLVDMVCCQVEIFHGEDVHASVLSTIPDWYKMNFPATLSIACLIIPSAVILRRNALLKLNTPPFDCALHPCEDWDLWIRLAKNGIKFKIIETSTCYYRRHPKQVTSNPGFSSYSYDYLANKHPGFFLYSNTNILQENIIKTTYLFDRTHGPIYRLLRSIDIFILGALSFIKKNIFFKQA